MRVAFLAGFLLVWLPLALVAQDSPPSGALTPMGALALAVLTPVVAWISSKLYDGLKTIIPGYDKLPALVHQVAAPVFGFVFGWLTTAIGAGAITDIHAVDLEWIAGILNALLMAGIKRYEKARTKVDATEVLEEDRASTVISRNA